MHRYLSLILFLGLAWGQIEDPFFDPNFPNDFPTSLNRFEEEIIINDSITISYNYDTELILLTINIKATSNVEVELNTESLKNNFVIKGSPRHSTAIKWINGKIKTEKTIILSLSPIKNDVKIIVPPFDIIIDGKIVKGKTIQIKQDLITVVKTYENGNIFLVYYHKKTSDKIKKIRTDSYYKNGNLESKSIYLDHEHYEDDANYRYEVRFYENGQKKSIGNYIGYYDDPCQGYRASWYQNGQKKSETPYNDASREDGIWKWWSPDGKDSSIVIFNDGRGEGLQISWHNNGQIETKGQYLDGERTGSWLQFHNNGKKTWQAIYKDGNIVKEKYWRKDGPVVE